MRLMKNVRRISVNLNAIHRVISYKNKAVEYRLIYFVYYTILSDRLLN